MNNTEIWHPWDNIFTTKPSKYAVVILNRPVNVNLCPNSVLNIWNKAMVRITVDGGTDRWLAWLKVNKFDTKKVKGPNLITGDMDSILKQTLHYYMDINGYTHVKLTPDQDETDFTKALRELKALASSENITLDTILVIADTSGRFDQTIANINTLFKVNKIWPEVKVYQIAGDSISWLLQAGHHTISVPKNLRDNHEWCALMPIGAPCRVTSTGLKWNLNNLLLEFGKMVSTSNTYNGDSTVSIRTDGPVLWSMGIDSLE